MKKLLDLLKIGLFAFALLVTAASMFPGESDAQVPGGPYLCYQSGSGCTISGEEEELQKWVPAPK